MNARNVAKTTSQSVQRYKNGFSLVELSIVLVILGLLVGGILGGQSLISAAELRSVMTDIQKYHSAVQTFRGKYFALPGDIRNATAFWGAAHATPSTCLTTVGTGTQTCDGDGDGLIEAGSTASARSESFMFWQHLANAGLIEGTFSGMSGNVTGALAGRHAIIGTNVPASKIGSVGYGIEYNNGPQIQYFQIGAVLNSPPWLPFIAPEKAWNIDKKMDDGLPQTGKITVSGGYTSCASSTAYALSNTGKECNLYVLDSF